MYFLAALIQVLPALQLPAVKYLLVPMKYPAMLMRVRLFNCMVSEAVQSFHTDGSNIKDKCNYSYKIKIIYFLYHLPISGCNLSL